MCIKLSQRFNCRGKETGQSVPHERVSLIRCSNVDNIIPETEPDGDQPCLAVLDQLIQWFDEDCPDCTGKPMHPWTAPIKEQMIDFVVNGPEAEALYEQANYFYRYAVYRLMYIYLTADPNGMDYFQLVGGTTSKESRAEKIRALVPEHICPAHPGSRMIGWPDRSAAEIRLNQLRESNGQEPGQWSSCDCFLAEHPFMANFATCLRKEIATYALSHAIGSLGAIGLNEAAYVAELDEITEMAFGEESDIASLQDTMARRPQGLGTVAECVPPWSSDQIKERLKDLYYTLRVGIQDARCQILVRKAVEEMTQARHDEYLTILAYREEIMENFIMRILAIDRGLTTARARQILRGFFGFLVPTTGVFTVNYEPQAWDGLWSLRTALLIDHHWALSRTGLPFLELFGDGNFKDWYDAYLHEWRRQVETNRRRAETVMRNLVKADADKTRQLIADGEMCFCGSGYDELEVPLDHPMQPKRCFQNGANHWASARCLVKDGVTWKGHQVTPPCCPFCRTPYEEVEDAPETDYDSDEEWEEQWED